MLEVGRVDRAHGLRGDVLVRLVTTETSRLDPGSSLRVGEAGGEVLTVRSSQPMSQRFLVHFEGIESREAAEALAGAVLRAEPIEDPEALWVHELIGAEVVDTGGVSRGCVEAVQANPASDLLVLDNGALVPLTFVVGWRRRGELLEVDPPAGLFDET